MRSEEFGMWWQISFVMCQTFKSEFDKGTKNEQTKVWNSWNKKFFLLTSTMLDVKCIRIELSNIHTTIGRIHRICNNHIRPNHAKAYLQKYFLIIDSWVALTNSYHWIEGVFDIFWILFINVILTGTQLNVFSPWYKLNCVIE